ncbi:MAG: phosphotransferase, partial [Clostridiales bacterium]|nr:phosphotransferase [Clostridiales bacterium]
FHNTRVRYENFLKAIEENKAGRRESVGDEIRFFMERKEYCGKIVDMLSNGQMPLRVTHNDTKLNNVLINIEEMKASTVIDLDTVMPGSIVYDFGDSIRSGANTGAEDEKDLDKVRFSLELFESYVKGFLKEVGERLTESEKENLAFGAIIMTYECGMRFLTDHLNGDVYFRIHRENHNLDRARTQMKMVTEMEGQFERMKEIVKDNLR